MTTTERKYLISIVAGIAVIIGWNAWCIQRDDAMFRVYYQQKAHKEFCSQQAGWHPDCNVK